MEEVIKEKKIYSISFSEFSSYLQCPHKWYLTYGLKFPSETNEELIFGSIVHKTIEELLLKPHLQRKSFLEFLVKSVLKDELKKVDDVNFLTRFSNSPLTYIFIKQATELINKLDFFVRFKDYDIVEVEHKLDGFKLVEFDDMLFVFKGYIDLILQHKENKRYLFLDWKTSKKAWDIKKKLKDNEDFFTQLGFYKLFYSKSKDIPLNKIDVKFFNLPREEPSEQKIYDGILNETYIDFLFTKLKDICTEIYHNDFMSLSKAKITTKKNYCHRCNFNTEKFCNDWDEFQVVI